MKEDGKDKTVLSPLIQGEGSPVPWSRISISALLMFVYYKSLLEEEQGSDLCIAGWLKTLMKCSNTLQ